MLGKQIIKVPFGDVNRNQIVFAGNRIRGTGNQGARRENLHSKSNLIFFYVSMDSYILKKRLLEGLEKVVGTRTKSLIRQAGQSCSQNPRAFWSAPRHGALE